MFGNEKINLFVRHLKIMENEKKKDKEHATKLMAETTKRVEQLKSLGK